MDPDEPGMFYGANAVEIAKDLMELVLNTDEVGRNESDYSIHLSSSDKENHRQQRLRGGKGRSSLNEVPNPNCDDMSQIPLRLATTDCGCQSQRPQIGATRLKTQAGCNGDFSEAHRQKKQLPLQGLEN